MKSLHKIQPNYNLTQEELSVLAYCELGMESNWEFKFTNMLYCRRIGESYWNKVRTHWYYPATMNIWQTHNKFMPDLSVIQR